MCNSKGRIKCMEGACRVGGGRDVERIRKREVVKTPRDGGRREGKWKASQQNLTVDYLDIRQVQRTRSIESDHEENRILGIPGKFVGRRERGREGREEKERDSNATCVCSRGDGLCGNSTPEKKRTLRKSLMGHAKRKKREGEKRKTIIIIKKTTRI